MTKVRLPDLSEADALLPDASSARLNRVGRRVSRAMAFARKYLGLSEISVEDLIALTDYLRESVQRIAAEAEAAPEPSEEPPALPRLDPDDAFFALPACDDAACEIHGDNATPDSLRAHITKVVRAMRHEIPQVAYAKVMALLEDPNTELVRVPMGVLLRAAKNSSGNPALN